VFHGTPVRTGVYRVRYFIRGSQVSVGTAREVLVGNVEADVHVPARHIIGHGLRCRYFLHFQESTHSTPAWAGLYVAPPKRSKWRRLAAVLTMSGASSAMGTAAGVVGGRKPPSATPYDDQAPI